MSRQKLLQIIMEEADASGFADGNKVKARYGDGFQETFIGLVRAGYIDNNCPVGSIALSPSGMRAAEA
jgi:hypothetical protein